MAFRHDRRRRVISEDAASGAETPDEANLGVKGAGAQESYAQAARRQQQPHIVDLVPIGWLGQTMIWLAGLTVIAGLELAYLYAPQLAPHLGPESMAALDLGGSASLGHWVSTMLLGATAGLAMLIYRLRSHRLDDYRGRYRVWGVLAPVAILLSMHETAPLEPLGAGAMRLLGHWTGLEDPRWWTLGVAACWALLAVRTIVETRRSMLASLTLGLATIVLLAGPAGAVWLAPELNAMQSVMLTSGLHLAGHLLLLSGVALYARHVILEAEGLIKSRARQAARPAKPKLKLKAKEAGEAESKANSKNTGTTDAVPKPRIAAQTPRTDLDSGKPVASARPTLSARSDTARSDTAASQPPRPHATEQRRESSVDDDEDNDTSGLTRAERKKMKREQRRAS